MHASHRLRAQIAYVVHDAQNVACDNHCTLNVDWKNGYVDHEKEFTFVLTILFDAYIIERFLLIRVARVCVTGQANLMYGGRRDAQKKMNLSPEAGLATRLSNSRIYTTCQHSDEKGAPHRPTILERVGWRWSGKSGPSLSTVISSGEYP